MKQEHKIPESFNKFLKKNFEPEFMDYDIESYYNHGISESENETAFLLDYSNYLKDKVKDRLMLQESKSDLEQAKAEEEQEKQKEIEVIQKEIETKKEDMNSFFTKLNKERQGEKQEILNEIKEYSPHTERLVISTLVAISTKKNIINVSEKGQSKTYSTKNLLNLLDIPFFEIKGHKTPKDFFELLKQYNGVNSLILIDESAMLFKSPEVLNNLLGALEKSKIEWREDSEDFEATVIFNTNWLPETPILRAVADRCILNEVNLNSNQLKEKILKARNYKPNKEVWNKIKNNLSLKSDINDIDLNKIYELIEKTTITSMRDKDRFIDIGLASLKLIGDLSLLEFFVDVNDIEEILSSDIKRCEKVKLIVEKRKISKRQAQRIIKVT